MAHVRLDGVAMVWVFRKYFTGSWIVDSFLQSHSVILSDTYILLYWPVIVDNFIFWLYRTSGTEDCTTSWVLCCKVWLADEVWAKSRWDGAPDMCQCHSAVPQCHSGPLYWNYPYPASSNAMRRGRVGSLVVKLLQAITRDDNGYKI